MLSKWRNHVINVNISSAGGSYSQYNVIELMLEGVQNAYVLRFDGYYVDLKAFKLMIYHGMKFVHYFGVNTLFTHASYD